MVKKVVSVLLIMVLSFHASTVLTVDPVLASDVSVHVFGCRKLKVVKGEKCSDLYLYRVSLTISQTSNEGVSLGWSDLPGVEEYVILRKNQQEKNFRMIARVSWRQRFFLDTQIRCGESYTYVVFARNELSTSRLSKPALATTLSC